MTFHLGSVGLDGPDVKDDFLDAHCGASAGRTMDDGRVIYRNIYFDVESMGSRDSELRRARSRATWPKVSKACSGVSILVGHVDVDGCWRLRSEVNSPSSPKD